MASGIRMRLKRINLDKAKMVERGSPVYAATERAAQAAVELAKKEAPRRSGELANSIEYRLVQTVNPLRVVADIGAGAGVGRQGAPFTKVMEWVNLGTAGPIVSTTPGRLLVLKNTEGSPIYRDAVAGQEANPFLVKAIKKVRKQNFEP